MMMTPSDSFDVAHHPHATLQALAAELGGPLVALDTSTPATSLAFVDPAHGVHELLWDAAERPCVVLVEGLGQLSAQCGQRIDAIAALVVGLGPGSFTGLRVGLATAKGLSLGAQLPLYGVSSLLTTALAAGPGLVLALQDARRGEVFAGLYRIDAAGGAHVLMADCAIMPDALSQAVMQICTALHVGCDTLKIVGHASEQWAAKFGARAQSVQMRAVWGLVACADAIKAGRSTDPVALVPQYLRLSEPQIQLLARQALMQKTPV